MPSSRIVSHTHIAAGDLGVTPIIQTAVSMLISSTLVHTDLHHNAIQPLPFVYPHVEHLPDPRELFDRIFKGRHKTEEDEKMEMERAKHNSQYGKRGFHYYFGMLIRFMFEGTEMNMIVAKCGPRTWPLRIIWTLAQGALLGIFFGFPLWCLAIVILGPIYGTGNMGGKWAPQAIKGVYGCIVGWVTNPVIATLALGSQAPQHIVLVPVDPETGSSVIEGDNITTIAEEEETGSMDGLAPPSPFLTPFRATTTGHIPGMPGRPRADTVTSSAGRSRSGSVQLAKPSLRTRSNSVVSLRPPLTCDVSCIQHSISCTVAPCLSPSQAPRSPLGTPSVARSRRLTVSSIRSTAPTAPPTPAPSAPSGPSPGPSGPLTPSTMQYQYALGGHGGRAKRSRANTTTTLPDSAILALGRPAGAVTPTRSERPFSARAASSSNLNTPPQPFARQRTNSDVAGGASHAPGNASPSSGHASLPVFAPGQDVFGDARNTVPTLRVQRPSLDYPSAPPRAPSAGSASVASSYHTPEGPLGDLRE